MGFRGSRVQIPPSRLKTILAVFALAAAVQLHAQQPILFADIPYGTTADSVQHRLETRGYQFVQVDNDGDLRFTGRLEGFPVTFPPRDPK